ncbi:unnamed protein product [Orchesella dallaii]|uniref:Uncharacterized protein n=1 Tax=Orchesella dallaii TaxID=48710 RepID=A0ABP1Q3V4_9HEXA
MTPRYCPSLKASVKAMAVFDCVIVSIAYFIGPVSVIHHLFTKNTAGNYRYNEITGIWQVLVAIAVMIFAITETILSLLRYHASNTKQEAMKRKRLKLWRKLIICCMFLQNIGVILACMSEIIGGNFVFVYLIWLVYKLFDISVVSVFIQYLKLCKISDVSLETIQSLPITSQDTIDPEAQCSTCLAQSFSPPPSYLSIFPVDIQSNGKKKNRRSEEYSVTLENFREEEEEIPQMNLNEFHNLHNNMPNGEAQQPAEEILHADGEEDEVAAEEDEGFDDDDDYVPPPPPRDETPPPPIIEVRRGAWNRNRLFSGYVQVPITPVVFNFHLIS